MKKRYFKHKDRFFDDTVFVTEENGKILSVDKDGTEMALRDFNSFLLFVYDGSWVEISKEEAEGLV